MIVLEADIIPTGNTVLRRFLLAEKDIAAGTAPVYADDVIESVAIPRYQGGPRIVCKRQLESPRRAKHS